GEPRNTVLHNGNAHVLSLADLSQDRAPRAEVITAAEEITAHRAAAYVHHASRSARHRMHLARGIDHLAALTSTVPSGASA
ncbi:MAG: hypothetical protein AAFX05_04850, partial [Planctomycetota bacterium]